MSDNGYDKGVAHYVEILRVGGIETFESCEGGPGHCYEVPTVAFHGDKSAGPKAFGVASAFGLPVAELRRYWDVIDGELIGPHWALTFTMKADIFIARDEVKSAAYFRSKSTGRSLP